MSKDKKVLAIIPARGGSKRIPKKNIKAFLGRPIIEYSIEAAISSGCFDEIMVSTDDQEIAAISERAGARVPFFRSPDNSNDQANTAEVIKEVIQEYEKNGQDYEYCCCLYPTAPFISAKKLKEGFDLLLTTKADSVLPVVSFSYPIQRALRIEANRLAMILPKNLNKRSQDLMSAYHDAGQFYWFRTKSLLAKMTILTGNTVPLIVPESEVQDIDNEEDWKIAEIKYRILKAPI